MDFYIAVTFLGWILEHYEIIVIWDLLVLRKLRGSDVRLLRSVVSGFLIN